MSVLEIISEWYMMRIETKQQKLIYEAENILSKRKTLGEEKDNIDQLIINELNSLEIYNNKY